MPTPLLPILHFLSCRQRGTGNEETCDFDLSLQDYNLLWVLLDQRGETQHQTGEVEAWPSCVLPYLPSLQAEGLPGSPEELSELGRWVLDSVRHDFFSQVDEIGRTSTRLWIRMGTIIHDQTANDVGTLLSNAISPFVGREVKAFSMQCEFSDTFQRMLAKQRQARHATNHPANTRLQARNIGARQRQKTATEEISGQQEVAIVGGSSTGKSTCGADTAAETHQEQAQEVEEEKTRYEKAQPDVCIFVGSTAEVPYPPIIVEVGFSHPLPPDRARSFIYGSDGGCRVVICLDIEYRDKEKRSQQYQAMETQGLRRQDPPYGITLNLFRCDIEANPDGQYDTYDVNHALRNVDVREAARLNQALELQGDDLVDEEEGDEDEDEDEERPINAPADASGRAKVIIPYADLVKIVDEAAWCMAVREHPSLQPQRKRKRVLKPKWLSTLPEPSLDDAPKPKKHK